MRPLQSKDIAAAILHAVTQPSYVDVNELRILFRPETCLAMGLANDATNLVMGQTNEAAPLLTASVRSDQRKCLRTASVRQDPRQYCVLVLRTHPVGSVVRRYIYYGP